MTLYSITESKCHDSVPFFPHYNYVCQVKFIHKSSQVHKGLHYVHKFSKDHNANLSLNHFKSIFTYSA